MMCERAQAEGLDIEISVDWLIPAWWSGDGNTDVLLSTLSGTRGEWINQSNSKSKLENIGDGG